MSRYSETCSKRREANTTALAAFELSSTTNKKSSSTFRTVTPGSGPTVFTIGYERRDGEDLISCLLDAGVELLVDVREKPFSRKVDFRKNVLAQHCEQAGIRYESWTSLGSTAYQRQQLKDTGDFSEFRKRFRDFARRGRTEEIDDLLEVASKTVIAMICYERAHEECHRSILADLLAERGDAEIVAIH
ncbi:MAG: DUF488 domain-containing protein [Planctomycetota bacterium]|nr:DUF488 domain-containing protein [Planctomycetota bacterium]